MAGHSKWANIKHKKAAVDRKKGRIFSRIAKEIMIAAKQSGGDPELNASLRTVLDKARAQNMPNTNIERAIKKGIGELGDVNFEEICYEAYGPGGIAVIIDVLTDNRNRSASEVRYALDRNGGNLASSGAVSFMFSRKAKFVITGDHADEDKLMDIVLDAGAEDICVEDGVAEIFGPPEAFAAIAKALSDAGIATDEADSVRHPGTVVELAELKTAQQALRLIEKLDELDDVQQVHSNFEIDDSIADQLEE